MNKTIAMATIAFVLLCMVLGVAVQAAVDALGAPGPLAGQVATFVVAIPLALLLSRRVGHLTHPSLLVASAVVAVASLWGTVFILNAIAEPAGGHVGWESLFNPMNWRNTVFGTVATLVVPQLWLLLLNRMAANHSSKPTPLRGAA